MRIAIRNPSPSSPRRFSAATRQSLKKISPVVEPLIPIFGSMPPDLEPRRARLDEERGDACMPRLGIGLGEDRVQVGDSGVRDEALGPFRTYSSPWRSAVVRIAAESDPEPGSVERIRAQPLPARELREVAPLLLLVAGQLEPERAELLHGEDEPGRRADLGDLLDRDEHHQRPGARTAVLLLEGKPEDVVLAEQLDHVPRELGGLVDLLGARRDTLARERADEVADLALLVGQRVVAGHEMSLFINE